MIPGFFVPIDILWIEFVLIGTGELNIYLKHFMATLD